MYTNGLLYGSERYFIGSCNFPKAKDWNRCKIKCKDYLMTLSQCSKSDHYGLLEEKQRLPADSDLGLFEPPHGWFASKCDIISQIKTNKYKILLCFVSVQLISHKLKHDENIQQILVPSTDSKIILFLFTLFLCFNVLIIYGWFKQWHMNWLTLPNTCSSHFNQITASVCNPSNIQLKQ